jgi:hypothetical protein
MQDKEFELNTLPSCSKKTRTIWKKVVGTPCLILTLTLHNFAMKMKGHLIAMTMTSGLVLELLCAGGISWFEDIQYRPTW